MSFVLSNNYKHCVKRVCVEGEQNGYYLSVEVVLNEDIVT